MTNYDHQNTEDEKDLDEDDEYGDDWVRFEEEEDNLKGAVRIATLEQGCCVRLRLVSPISRNVLTDFEMICWNSFSGQE